MRVEEWFALAIRVIGVAVFLYGIGYLLDSSLFHLGYFNYPESSPGYYVIAGIAYGVAGLYLIRGAPHIVRFAYPADEEKENNGQEEETDRPDA
jgi:hypothetical protein